MKQASHSGADAASGNTSSRGVTATPQWARPAAIVWTVFILAACFVPGNEIPEVRIPLIDKWVHFVLFGIFAFLWLRVFPSRAAARLLLVFLIAAAFGYAVELLQGALHPLLGRSYSGTDALADAIGGALGVVAFYFWLLRKKPGASTVGHTVILSFFFPSLFH